MALNAKQKQFITEYLVDKNATRAAKACGYSEKSAYAIGSENLKKPEIRAAIQKGLDRQRMDAVVAASKLGMTKERWLEELVLIATANLDDYAQVTKRKVGNGTDGGEYVVTSVNAVPTKARPPEFGRVIRKLSETKNGIGIELHSKQAALDTLGKHFGWVKERHEMSGPDGGPQVIITIPSNGREVQAPTPIQQPQTSEGKDDANGNDGSTDNK